jgi:hypothetical protein
MALAAVKVMGPEYVAAAPLFIKAPLPLVPVPPSDKGSAVAKVMPFKSKLPLPLTTVPDDIVPNALTLPNFNVPALIVVKPV